MSNKTHATFYDPRKPCKGTNANICVAEGCFGESCLTVFPVQNAGQNEFPVEKPVQNRKRFSGKKTLHTVINLTLALTLLVVLITSLIVVASAIGARGWSVLDAVVLYAISVCIFEAGFKALKKGLKRDEEV